MNRSVRVTTWKIGSDRYLHEVEVKERGWFHIVSFSVCFSLKSFIIRNKAVSKRNIKETNGLRKVRLEREEWLDEEDWANLCFGGSDNMELRKKIYGKYGKVKILILVYPESGRIEEIKREGERDMIPGHCVWLKRDLKKKLRDPLPYISLRHINPKWGEIPVKKSYLVSELSYHMFRLRVREWLDEKLRV